VLRSPHIIMYVCTGTRLSVVQGSFVNESSMEQSQRRWPATAIICVICDIGLQVVIVI
jgi:hypothetical protein